MQSRTTIDGSSKIIEGKLGFLIHTRLTVLWKTGSPVNTQKGTPGSLSKEKMSKDTNLTKILDEVSKGEFLGIEVVLNLCRLEDRIEPTFQETSDMDIDKYLFNQSSSEDQVSLLDNARVEGPTADRFDEDAIDGRFSLSPTTYRLQFLHAFWNFDRWGYFTNQLYCEEFS